MPTKFGFFIRLQYALLVIICPQSLVMAITASFVAATDSLEDYELRILLKEMNDAN